jgi:hypothetical protein
MGLLPTPMLTVHIQVALRTCCSVSETMVDSTPTNGNGASTSTSVKYSRPVLEVPNWDSGMKRYQQTVPSKAGNAGVYQRLRVFSGTANQVCTPRD